ncbi:unnamed protein product, partial [marine sediment metagenome]
MKNDLLVPIVEDGGKPPIFFVPSAGTTAFSFVRLARSLKSQQPFYAFDYTNLGNNQPPLTS